MYSKIISILMFVLVLSISFALAVQGDNQINTTGNGEGNQNNTLSSGNQNSGAIKQQTQEQIRTQVQDGTHMSEGGQMLKIQTQANNQIRLEVEGISANCNCEIIQEKVQNKTKLQAKLSNGKNAEIKIMPNTASEKALEQLRLRVCSQENNCSIELKEVGSGEKAKLAYEIKTQRQSRVLGLFKAKMQVQAQIDAENGQVIKTNKPWWAFLATEPEE